MLSSRRGLCEVLRTDVAGMTVAPGPVVEHFNEIEDIRPGQTQVLYVIFLMRSFFSELKNDSATVLTLLCQGQAVGIGKVR
jgi:hypothetical protein